MVSLLMAIGLVVVSSFIGACGGLLIKLGADKLEFKISHLIRNIELIGGILCYVFGMALFVVALKFGDLSVLYPFSSLTYIWILLLSKKFLKEELNTYKIFAILLIIAGVSLIGIGA